MLFKNTLSRFLMAFSIVICSGNAAMGQMDVLLEFDADWETNLLTVTTDGGVDSFSAAEISTIESLIADDFSRVFADFDIGFFTVAPPGAHTAIDFGATTGTSGLFGEAPVDMFNVSAGDVASVYTHNFGEFIDEFSGSVDRAEQIAQLSQAIANTAVHELGHTIGIVHEHSYGTPGITLDTYGDTGGLQNLHIMSTGATGLTELEREMPRTLSQFSTLMLEAAGGLDPFIHGVSGVPLSPAVVLEEHEYFSSDAGTGFFDATELILTEMPISGMMASHVSSDITSAADIDMFSLAIDDAGWVSAQLISDRLIGDFGLDGVITLYGPDMAEILEVDGTYFDGDVYGSGPIKSIDPFLINVFLSDPGLYFLRVTGITGGDALGDYSMVVGFQAMTVPEPGTTVLLASLAGCMVVRRRRKST